MLFDIMQKREAFHLAFLRALTRSVPLSGLALKGGCNLRFFFGSDRYSEDIDLDVSGVAVHVLCDKVMSVLRSAGLTASVRIFGIESIQPPDLGRAKQTETVQRFKVHLITSAGEDLPAKIEFSRREMDSPILLEPVSPRILAAYRMAPMIVPHYGVRAAARQKIRALVTRRQPAARDVFDLYVLSSRPEMSDMKPAGEIVPEELHQAIERVYSLDFERFRETVACFLGAEDQVTYAQSQMWDQIRLVAISMIERGLVDGG